MALEKYKICPACGERNAPSLLECRRCETDLTGVRVVDGSAGDRTAEQISVPEGLVRVCECGEANPPQARKCRACGEDISYIIPTVQKEAESGRFPYKLESLDGCCSAVFAENELILGREARLGEYLSCKMYVSRRHARLTVADGVVYIENLSGTNRTFVNNELIDDGRPFALKTGDEIGLGGKEIDGGRQPQAAFFRFTAPI